MKPGEAMEFEAPETEVPGQLGKAMMTKEEVEADLRKALEGAAM